MARERPEAWLEGRNAFSIYYEDTDFSGYVYHANYLKFFERSREEIVGLDFVRELYERGVHYVVHKIDLTYHAPARHGDRIVVESKLRLSESPVSLWQQTAFKEEKDGKAPTRLVSADLKLVAVNHKGEAIRVPKDVVDRFISMMPPTS